MPIAPIVQKRRNNGWLRLKSTVKSARKGPGGKPLSEEQKHTNRMKSKVRARVEHVFGAQAAMGGHLVRTIGLQRAKVKIGMMNLVYNMMRLMQLIKHDAKVISRNMTDPRGKGVPVGA